MTFKLQGRIAATPTSMEADGKLNSRSTKTCDENILPKLDTNSPQSLVSNRSLVGLQIR